MDLPSGGSKLKIAPSVTSPVLGQSLGHSPSVQATVALQLSLTQSDLALLNKYISESIRTQSSSLMEQPPKESLKAALQFLRTQSPQHLIQLKFTTPQGASSLWALSDKTFPVGHTLSIRPQRGAFLYSDRTNNTKSSLTPSAHLSPTTNNQTLNTPPPSLQAGSEIELDINQALRKYLPSRDTNHTALKAIDQLSKIVRESAVSATPFSTPKTSNPLEPPVTTQLQKSLKLWNTQTPQLGTQISGKQIQQSIQASGIFLESSLRNNLEETKAAPTPPLPQLQDTKALLLTLSTLLNISPNTNSNQSASTNTLIDALISMFLPKNKLQNKSNEGDSKPALKFARESALRALTEGLANISSHQFSAQKYTFHEGNTHHWNTEIFLRHEKELVPIDVKLESREQENSDPDKKKTRSWHITLEWEFKNSAQFISEINFTNGKINSKIWASDSDTRHKIRRHLNRLLKQFDASDIAIDTLSCPEQAPNIQRPLQGKNIVDVST